MKSINPGTSLYLSWMMNNRTIILRYMKVEITDLKILIVQILVKKNLKKMKRTRKRMMDRVQRHLEKVIHKLK